MCHKEVWLHRWRTWGSSCALNTGLKTRRWNYQTHPAPSPVGIPHLLGISGLSSSEQPLSGDKGHIYYHLFFTFLRENSFPEPVPTSPCQASSNVPPQGFPLGPQASGHKQSHIKIWCLGTKVVVHWLSLCTFNAEPASIPGQEPRSHRPQLKTLHATAKIRDPVCFN